MTEQEEIINTIKVLRKEVEVLTKRTRDRGTGHLYTAIGVINGRIDELIGSAIDGQPDEIRDLTSEIYGEDVYDGYKEHTEAMEQARLRKIQDSAAGRKPDDYEHTKEYYDTERNKPVAEHNLGLYESAIKEKYGRAVQTIRPMEGEDLHRRPMTVSEKMQEELEPLPINTFK